MIKQFGGAIACLLLAGSDVLASDGAASRVLWKTAWLWWLLCSLWLTFMETAGQSADLLPSPYRHTGTKFSERSYRRSCLTTDKPMNWDKCFTDVPPYHPPRQLEAVGISHSRKPPNTTLPEIALDISTVSHQAETPLEHIRSPGRKDTPYHVGPPLHI
jgi:hypothetical protein